MPRDAIEKKKYDETDFTAKVTFGGGLHTRAPEYDIHPSECAGGKNFDLGLQSTQFKNRKPFDLIGTVPNAAEIRGGATLLKTDGTVSTLIQAGDTVYEWDGATTFTSKGTVAATAKLRGPLQQNWKLTDEVIITDLNLVDVVMKWDGTTLADVAFTNETGSTSFGAFKARYCLVSNERAIFSNINEPAAGAFPHLMIGSQISDYTIITVNQKPSSALSEGDPFFLVQPDLHYINGVVEAFGVVATSSKKGSMYKLTGSSAKDFAFAELYPRSGTSSDEAIAYVGNDIVYGRQGRIESLTSTDKYGDVDTDDLSSDIADQIDSYDSWNLVYNSRNQRVYCFTGESELWVFHKSLYGEVSAWSRWSTTHALSLDPTFAMSMLDPSDGLEYVFMGDASGNFYRLEGTGASGDGGTEMIESERLSGMITVPEDFESSSVEGWISYRIGDTVNIVVTILYSGYEIFSDTITVSTSGLSGLSSYSGGGYYSNGVYYAGFSGKLSRVPLGFIGGGNEMQVKIEVESNKDFTIREVGLKFKAS